MKKMSRCAIVLSALITLLVAGCTVRTTNAQIAKAFEVCENNEGLKYVDSPSNDEYKYVVCKNGAEFRLTPNMIAAGI